MFQYVARRLAAGCLTVFFIATVTFTAMHLIPGDPVSGAKAMNPIVKANIMARYGLDQPVLVQYKLFITQMLKGDFGISFTQQNRAVNDIISEHFPVSAKLGILSVLIAAVGGVMFGSLTALFRNRAPDKVIMLGVVLAISVPSFVFAAVSQYTVTEINQAIGGEFLPVGGWGSFKHMLLPAVVLGLATMAFVVRLMRSSILEIVHLDYIKTAKAKGLSPSRIFFAHQLRNAILPVVTFMGPAIATITTGGFVVETVFSIPGLGRYFVQAVQQLDYTVIMGLTVFYGAFLVFMVIFVDILYGFIDPRISLGKGKA